MNQNMHTALLVLLIGMVTVFIVLCLVVLSGKLLILLVNKYGPVSNKSSIKDADFLPLIPNTQGSVATIPKEKLAAIVTTVEIITRGKGTILNIDKSKP